MTLHSCGEDETFTEQSEEARKVCGILLSSVDILQIQYFQSLVTISKL